MLDHEQIVRIIEAALLAAEQPLAVDRLLALFDEGEADRQAIRDAVEALEQGCASRGYELKLVASGYRFQVRQELSPWISRLWDERPPRYSRAMMETLALIAYKQPVTRGDIEEVRGVAVSSNIMRTLLERDWIRVVGYREVPGRPAIYATTKAFLDYFNLRSLDELPPLAEIRALTEPHVDDLVQAGPEYAEGLLGDVPEAQADPQGAAAEDLAQVDAAAPDSERGAEQTGAAEIDSGNAEQDDGDADAGPADHAAMDHRSVREKGV
jgi:segregation and condensation protein B